MAETHDFPGSTHHYGPPPGLEEMIGWLHCFSNGRCVVSAWRPTPEELDRLNAGESLFVSVMSGSTPDGRPIVYPMFVGTEEETKAVVSDTGGVWGVTKAVTADPTVEYYRSGQCRNDEHALTHTYAQMSDGELWPMCGYGWNRSDGTRFSILRGSPGTEGDCQLCRRNVAAGRPPATQGFPHKTKWL